MFFLQSKLIDTQIQRKILKYEVVITSLIKRTDIAIIAYQLINYLSPQQFMQYFFVF